MQAKNQKIVVLGTGGTIAGESNSVQQGLVYEAAKLGIADMLQSIMGPLNALPEALTACQFESEQVAQMDSKDMDFETWMRLAHKCQDLLEQDSVSALVITHGTDTLEETAYFLSQVVRADKPIVMTCAMRPANFENADGPQNLRDALLAATQLKGQGVWLVAAGEIHHSLYVQKVHPTRLNAFDSGDRGVVASIQNDVIHFSQDWQLPEPTNAIDIDSLPSSPTWPWVEIVMNHVQTNPKHIDVLCASGVQGIVVAGTGNGSISQSMQSALLSAEASGVEVRISSRCSQGAVVQTEMHQFEVSRGLNPAKARVALILVLMAQSRA
jgi:L-asparaginase